MSGKYSKFTLQGGSLLLALAIALVSAPSHAAGDIDAARLKAADAEPQNWFTLGRDGDQTYFSPLATIDATNVEKLGFAWTYDLTTARGQEGVTPDLRKLPPEVHAEFKNIVLKGDFAPLGMERFDDILSEADVDAIHAYLVDQAWQGYKAQTPN